MSTSALNLFDELPAAAMVVSPAGEVVQANRALTELVGRARAEIVGRNVTALILPDDDAQAATAGSLGAPGGELAPPKRRRLRREDGTIHLVDERTSVLADGRLLSVFRHVTAGVAADDELRRKQEHLLFVVNEVPALIAYVGTDAHYVWGNETYRRWLGISPEEMCGRHPIDVIGMASWLNVRPHVERAIAGEQVSIDNRVVFADGVPHDLRATYVPDRGADGEVRGFLALATDLSETRQAEQALQHSERMLAESQAAAHVGSWEAVFGNGDDAPPDSVRWSDEAYRMFGLDPTETRMTFAKFMAAIHPDDRAGMRATTVAGMKNGGRFEKEYRIVRPDGALRIIHAWTTVERVAGRPTQMHGTCQDVTERRLAAQEIRAAREQLQLVMDSTPTFIVRCDREGRLVWTNKSYAARFGKTPEELAGKLLRELIGEEAFSVIEERLDRAIRGEAFEYEVELPYRTLGKRWIHVVIAPTLDADGAPDGCVALMTDNTRRHELERALRISEERCRLLTRTITSLVWTSNAIGELVEPQPAWEAYTGQTWEQQQGSGWRSAIHPDDRQAIDDVGPKAMQEGSFRRLPCRIWHAASGSYRFAEISAVAIRNPDGSIREWIGTLIDVHERERARQELNEADRRKDEFLAMLSHELRNPLAPILSSVEILGLVDQRDPEMAATYRGVIAQQVKHMKRLIDDLLDVSRVSRGTIELRKERLDLQPILLQAVEVSRSLIAEKEQTLSVAQAPGPISIDADPVRVVQIFSNLLDNAAKYSHRGGHIALEMTVEGGEALVRVRDNGVGMSPDLLESAFDLFVQETRSLDRAQGGLGIGLTLVRNLVKLHGGSVRATSAGPGLGCELLVRLPLA
jgi:PAS domain S-box-containing protein